MGNLAIPIPDQQLDDDQLLRRPSNARAISTAAAPAIPLPTDSEQLRRIMTNIRPVMPNAMSGTEAPSIAVEGRAMPSLPIATSQTPRAVSNRGIPIDLGGKPIPVNRATGQPEQLNNAGKAIAPGISGLWARSENINNPILRTLGKIGAVGARAIDIGGSVAAPGVMAQIPGTSLHQALSENRAARQQKEDTANAATQAKTAEEQEATRDMPAKAALENAQAQKALNPAEDWNVVPGMVNNQGQVLLHEKNSNQLKWSDITGAQPLKPPADTQTQNKEKFQSVVSKVDAARLPTDEKSLSKSLDAALQAGKITPEEHQAARGYLAANPTPSTNLSVHVEGAQATNAMKEAGKTYLYNGELVRGDKVPAGADATLIKDPEAFKQEARNSDIVAKSFNHLVNDDARIFDDSRARAVLATALDENQAHSMGLLIAGTGGSLSLPAGTGKIVDQLLENHAVPENLRRDVKDYIVDYWAMKDKLLMVQMQMQNGKMGRGNKAYFDAMVQQLPGPATSDSTMARRQLRDFSETLDALRGQYGNLPKESPAHVTGDVGGGGLSVHAPNGKTYVFKDQASADAFRKEAGIQ